MHKQPVYQNASAYVNGVSEAIFKIGVCLPAGPMVTNDDVCYIFCFFWKCVLKSSRPSLPLKKAPPCSPSLSSLRDERM